MSKKINNLYEFGEFRLDTVERVLYRKDKTVTLAPKVFETLLCLVENNGKIISKEDLMSEVWQNSFVEESNLTQNIYTLRQIFGKRNKFIETVPRRGYRFTADVKIIGNESSIEKLNGNLSEIVVSRKTTATLLREEIIEEDGDNVYLIQKSKILPEPNKQPFFQSRKFQLGLVIGLFAAILIGTISFFVWRRNFAAPSNALLEKIIFSNLTDTGDVKQIAVSPDGQFLAFIKKDDSIWLKDINSKQDLPLNLAKEFNPQAVHFSPDGNSIYFLNRKNAVSGAEIYKTSRFGGNAEFIVGNVWSEFSISADGSKIAFYRKSPSENEHYLVVTNLTDKSEKFLLTKHFPEGFDLRSSPAWSPDGKEIYAIAKPQDKPNSTLVKVNLENSQEKTINTPQIRQFVAITALPDNENLIFSAREQNKFPQVYKMKKTGVAIQRLTNDLNLYRKLSLSADGKSLVALQKNNASHLWLLPDLKTENARQLTFGKNNRDAKHGLDVLPDGKIVFTSLEDLNRDLWIFSPQDNTKQQLTIKQNEANERPLVSKDGEFIYFSSLNDQTYDIKKIQPNGQNAQTITSDNAANDLFPNVSADSTLLYFIRKTKGKSAIIRKNLTNSEETEIKLPEGFSPDSFLALSPDGKFLAFRLADLERKTDLEEEASNLIKLGIISTDENLQKAKTIEINTSQSQFRWDEKSEAIYFINHSAENSAICKQSVFENIEAQKIIELKNTRIYHFQLTKEKDLIISQGKTLDDAVLIKNF